MGREKEKEKAPKPDTIEKKRKHEERSAREDRRKRRKHEERSGRVSREKSYGEMSERESRERKHEDSSGTTFRVNMYGERGERGSRERKQRNRSRGRSREKKHRDRSRKRSLERRSRERSSRRSRERKHREKSRRRSHERKHEESSERGSQKRGHGERSEREVKKNNIQTDDLEPELPLGTLFSSPFFWNSKKVCDFIVASHKKIHENQSARDFKSGLDDASLQCNLWGAKSNWKDVLGDHYVIMSTFYQQNPKTLVITTSEIKNINTKSVVKLQVTIRNKYSHAHLISEADKRSLGWFQFVNGEYCLDDKLFVAYWIRKFPKLFLFLWLQFQHFRNTPELAEFYKCELPPFSKDLFDKFSCLPQQVLVALEQQLNLGFVNARYNFKGNEDAKLEFRTLSKTASDSIMVRDVTLEISIRGNTVSCRWYKQISGDKVFIEKVVTSLDAEDSKKILKCFEGNIIICSRICDFNERILCQDFVDLGGSTVILTCRENNSLDYSDIDNLLQKVENIGRVSFSRADVLWEDLTSKSRHMIKTEGSVSFFGAKVQLADILPEDRKESQNLLTSLSGNLLNDMLKKSSPKFWEKGQIPLLSEAYVRRRIHKRILFKIIDVVNILENEICVITNISEDNFMDVLNKNNIEIQLFKNLKGERLHITESNWSDTSIIIKELKLEKLGEKIPIHFFQYFYRNVFEWLETKGSTLVLEGLYPNFLNDSMKVFETEIEGKVARENNKTVLIADKAGSGKSQLLIQIMKHIITEKRPKHKFVLFSTMSEIMNRLSNKLPTEEEVVEAICDIHCTTKFEKNVLKHRLHLKEKDFHDRLSFHVMLDSLDEVQAEHQASAVQVINIIHKELFPVKVWVTLRDYLVEPLLDELGDSTISLCKLEIFNESAQFECLLNHWEKLTLNKFSSHKDVINFTKNCLQAPSLQNDTELRNTPLMCWILAEIYTNQILAGKLEVLKDFDVYIEFANTKLEIYLKRNNINIKRGNRVFKSLLKEMYLLHAVFAMKSIFSEGVSKQFQNRLLVTVGCIKTAEKVVTEYGFVQSVKPLTFHHRKLAEYFCAWFIHEGLASECFCVSIVDEDFYNVVVNHVLGISGIDQFKRKVFWNTSLLQLLKSELKKSRLICIPAFVDDKFDFMQVYDVMYGIRMLLSFQNKPSKYFSPVLARPSLDLDLVEKIVAMYDGSLAYFLFSSSEKLSTLFCIFAILSHVYSSFRYPTLEYILTIALSNFQNWTGKNKYGILHIAVASLLTASRKKFRPSDYLEFMRLIFSKNASLINQKDAYGQTALMFLLKHVDPRMPYFKACLEFLVSIPHVDLNARDNNGNTLLHFTKPLYNMTETPANTFLDNHVLESFEESYNVVHFIQALGQSNVVGSLEAKEKLKKIHKLYIAERIERREKSNITEIYIDIWTILLKHGLDKNSISFRNNNNQTPLLAILETHGDVMLPAVSYFASLPDFHCTDDERKLLLDVAKKGSAEQVIALIKSFEETDKNNKEEIPGK